MITPRTARWIASAGNFGLPKPPGLTGLSLIGDVSPFRGTTRPCGVLHRYAHDNVASEKVLEKVREESVLRICIDESGQELFLLLLERDVEGEMMESGG